MKTFALLLSMLLISCQSQSDKIMSENAENTSSQASSKTVATVNEKCESIQEFKVFQVLKDGALAFACEDGTRFCSGLTVFLPSQENTDYYDEMIIRAPKGKCISYGGVQKYTTVKGVSKTIPRLQMIDR